MHQQQPSILTERTGRIASGLGTQLMSHPVPGRLLHSNYGDFHHKQIRTYDKPYTKFQTGPDFIPRGVASSNGFEPLLTCCHTPTEIAYWRQQTGESGPTLHGVDPRG